ncbi:DUF7344 domain-containing protein [Haloplanus salilacus]|uniref:DUF7344 domain-containing protein n=1 Tax=Haloplanus salilacus TaxID=2949994 RepID=UPI0030D3ACF7
MTQRTVDSSLDVTFDVLGDGYRRRLLVTLSEREPRHATDALDSAENAEARIDVRHRHLPKLVDAGFVEWDRETDELWRGKHFDEVRPLLELLSTDDDDDRL